MSTVSPAVPVGLPPPLGELLAFFLLAYALSWWPFALRQGALPHGPALAAVAVIALFSGREALAQFWRRLTQFRAGWWYLVGPAVVLFYHAAAFMIMQVVGTPIAQAPSLTVSTLLVLLVLGGQWEELGWTGYALPRLRQFFASRANPLLTAAVVLGLFRALWHLPLVLSGAVLWFDMLFLALAMQLIIAWIYDRSGGSVPAVVAFHYASNIAGATMGAVFDGHNRVIYFATFIAIACIVALLVSIPRGHRLPRSDEPFRR